MALEWPQGLDFVARQTHNQRCSAVLVSCFMLFLLLIGGAVDYLYFDAFTSTAFPIATVIALSFTTLSTLVRMILGI